MRAALAEMCIRDRRIPGQAPQKTGALQGVVRDGSKNPVIAASVLLRNLATGREQKKSSDAQGVFRFIDVLPGQYELSVDAPGYAKFTEDGVEVSAGSVVIREIKLTAIPVAIAPSTSLPQLPPRAAPNNAAAAETPPSIGYPETKENLSLNVGANMPAPEPVSYTHLDVYKRQDR